MFGGHGHSHDGAPCHGHGHGHSHGGGGGGANVGFGPDPTTMAALANAFKSGQANQAMMPQINPQMMEFAKKMYEQRQVLMKQFAEQQKNGLNPNPQQFQEAMMKAAQEMANKIKDQEGAPDAAIGTGNVNSDALDRFLQREEAPDLARNQTSNAASLLSANLNSSKLNELINGKEPTKVNKTDDESRILDMIAKKDYSELNAVKATQYGVLDRVKELVESGQVEADKPDAENVYLLHWAAINNRLEIAKYLLSIGASVDPIGGELESTPLNWAARSGHVHMVIYLMNNGASSNLFDVEGFSTIHLATMFGHSNVVAYLLAKGIDADMPDKQGATPLMYAAQRIHSRDPAQLLITFNARLNAQDHKGNTPLHYCVAFNNHVVLQILLEKGASLDIKNNKGQTAYEFALERKKHSAVHLLSSYADDDRKSFPPLIRSFSSKKDVRKMFTKFFPFFVLFYLGILFQANVLWIYKAVAFGLIYLIAYTFKMLFFDRYVGKYIPIATTMAFIFWLYTTWFVYFRPLVFDLFSIYSISFVMVTYLSWYNFYKAWKTNPGIISANRDQMNKTILQFVEQNEFSLDQFCTACIIRKPLRSKHCSECDHCVAKFDHHCPWVDNCIGQNNLKYFVGFIFWTPVCLAFYVHGAITFYKETCWKTDLAENPSITSFGMLVQFCYCSPWVAFFSIVALINLIWISCLCICHLYQGVVLSLTTNERMNLSRYRHFFDKQGNYHNPFHFGLCQNFVDLVDINLGFYKPSLVNWTKEHDIQDLLNSRLDKKKEMGKYMDV